MNGLSSGEEIESDWAKLMHLWLRVREMSSSNRHDELAENLHHIAGECVQALGVKLKRQYLRATKTLTQNLIKLKMYRHQSASSDQAVLDWYAQYRLQRDRQQNDISIDITEQRRLALIEANENVLYWISLMRTHDHHNYKTRITISQFVMDASNKRRTALEDYNDIRTEADARFERLTLDGCQRSGILSREYFDSARCEHWKYLHFDCLQLIARANEELVYSRIEITSLLEYGRVEIAEYKRLQEKTRYDLDTSVHMMYTERLRGSIDQSDTWRADLACILRLLGIPAVDLDECAEELIHEEEPPPGELPKDRDDDDWEDYNHIYQSNVV